MPYKTRRQPRYQRLRDCGFTPFEARGLSRVSQRVPYVLPLMKQRLAEYTRAIKRAKKQGILEQDFNKQWLTHIKRRYIMKGWKHKSDVWGTTAAFRMLKDTERIYKLNHPSYDSPWEKRRKAWQDFTRKLEKTYEDRKYPKSMPVVKIRYKPEGGAEIVE